MSVVGEATDVACGRGLSIFVVTLRNSSGYMEFLKLASWTKLVRLRAGQCSIHANSLTVVATQLRRGMNDIKPGRKSKVFLRMLSRV